MATIRRTRQAKSYLTLANAVARDSRLSHRARGILVWILSLPDDATANSDTLAKDDRDPLDDREGRDAIRSALRDLERVGYAKLVKVRDERGRITSEWHVGDEAAPKPDRPTPEIQAPVKNSQKRNAPTPEKPTPVNQAPSKRHSKKTAAAEASPEERNAIDVLTSAGVSAATAAELAKLARPAEYVAAAIAAARRATNPVRWLIVAVQRGDYELSPVKQQRKKLDAAVDKKRAEMDGKLDAAREAESERRAAALSTTVAHRGFAFCSGKLAPWPGALVSSGTP